MSKENVILGINGYSKRVHDSAACLTIDGEVIAMAEEERFTRRKNAFGQVPYHCIAYCLEEAGLTVNDVDVIALGWDFNQVFKNIGKQSQTEQELINLFLPIDKFPQSKKLRLEMVPHHLAHAASSYYLSGNNESIVFVIDGQGENQATSVYVAHGSELKLIKEFPVKDSLGYFYEAVSEHAGLSRLDAGKTMGLASYGEPKHNIDLLQIESDGYSVDMPMPPQTEMDLQQEITGQWSEYLKKTFGEGNKAFSRYDSKKAKFNRETIFSQEDKDLAASAQSALEQVVMHLIAYYTRVYQIEQICIAGGVGLNCSMNGKIAQSGQVKSLSVPPFAGDAGVAAGAALYLSSEKPNKPLDSASLGPEFSNDTIIETLNTLGIRFQMFDDISAEVAKLLVQDKIIFWFQGRMEVGPRALGNRSILGNPMFRTTHDRLNSIKNREQWRPLAPSFLAEKVGEYMTEGGSSPFMLKAYIARSEVKNKIPAAIHVDGTSRVQTVSELTNPLYYRVIKEFERMTGIPAVMNTSLNLDNEPIVCSPVDAIRTFYSSAADYLAIGNELVSKK